VDGPGIDEPRGSVTIDLSPIFPEQGSQFAAGEEAVNAVNASAERDTAESACTDIKAPRKRGAPRRRAASADARGGGRHIRDHDPGNKPAALTRALDARASVAPGQATAGRPGACRANAHRRRSQDEGRVPGAV
jgi:hypothetical protein